MAASRSAYLAQLQGQANSLEARMTFLEGQTQRRCTSLLWMGSVSGLLGFIFAFLLGFWTFMQPGKLFESGWGYFPPTVSEMVHDPSSPAGKSFFCFELIGAICIFMSWYPWELQNAYIGDELKTWFGVSWVNCRQFFPPIGMMIVACVPTTPAAQATMPEQVTVMIHTAGAFFMFIGYILIEGKTLSWGGFKCPPEYVKIGPQELWTRKLLLTGCFCGFMAFSIFQALLALPLGLAGADRWELKPGFSRVQLVDTASGWILMFKVGSYAGEVVSGLFLIASHLSIWYHCHERKVNLADTIPVSAYT